MYENGEKLGPLLKDKEKEIIKKFCDAQSEVHGLENSEYFIEGFQLSARLVLESFECAYLLMCKFFVSVTSFNGVKE